MSMKERRHYSRGFTYCNRSPQALWQTKNKVAHVTLLCAAETQRAEETRYIERGKLWTRSKNDAENFPMSL